ncbi:MAG: PadR family transcriptional regulator [Acidimicrobiales bacterium]
MSRVFAHGALRLYLLSLLEDGPRHGYELIRMMEDRFMGLYTPSAGTVYPRLTALEDVGLVAHEVIDGKKVYRLTDAGRGEVAERRKEIDDVVANAVKSAGEVAREIRDEVRSSVRDLRQEIKEAVKDVRREERRVGRESERSARDAARDARDIAREASRDAQEAARMARDLVRGRTGDESRLYPEVVTDGDDFRVLFRSLRRDLEAFVSDVVAAARQHNIDADRARQVSAALIEARQVVITALSADPTDDRR